MSDSKPSHIKIKLKEKKEKEKFIKEEKDKKKRIKGKFNYTKKRSESYLLSVEPRIKGTKTSVCTAGTMRCKGYVCDATFFFFDKMFVMLLVYIYILFAVYKKK